MCQARSRRSWWPAHRWLPAPHPAPRCRPPHPPRGARRCCSCWRRAQGETAPAVAAALGPAGQLPAPLPPRLSPPRCCAPPASGAPAAAHCAFGGPRCSSFCATRMICNMYAIAQLRTPSRASIPLIIRPPHPYETSTAATSAHLPGSNSSSRWNLRHCKGAVDEALSSRGKIYMVVKGGGSEALRLRGSRR